MKETTRSIVAGLIVCIFGFTLFFTGTDGFTAFTSETARVKALIVSKPAFPDVTVTDSKSRSYDVSEFEGQYMFVTFMYTDCMDECPLLEMNMGQVYDAIPEKYRDDIQFISISFNPEEDDEAALAHYEHLFGADGETWRMATVNDKDELKSLLDAFGVIVIPDGKGDFAHNSAFYLVDRDGNLKDVMDYTDITAAAERVSSVLENGGGE